MEATLSNKPHAITWIAGIAATVFSVVGIAAIMGWIPTSRGSHVEEMTQANVESVQSAPKAFQSADHKAARHTQHKAARTKTIEHSSESAMSASTHAPQAPEIVPVRLASVVPTRNAICHECGVVESVLTLESPGEASGIGAVGGAVVGGVLGNQIGRGNGRKIATVAGAVGGAVAGHQIEKYMKKETSYEITVRLEDGSSRVFHDTASSAWRTGDRVKIVDGAIRSNS